MPARPTRDWMRGLPKAELHVHLEGTLEPEMMLALARRNGLALPWPDAATIRAAYAFGNLQEFLDLYYRGMGVLLTHADYVDLACTAMERAAADGVVHAEFFYDPQGHTSRGVPFDVVTGGLLAGLAEGERRFGVSWRLIPNLLRHLPEDDALTTLRVAEPWLLDGRLHGVGLDSSERDFPPERFARAYAWAAERGLFRTAHAGEEGPAAYVATALDVLGVHRIDHGNRALEDPALVSRLAALGIGLTVCPLSNLRLRGVACLTEHPLRQMLDAGLKVTLNGDDPAYFGGTCLDNFVAIADALELSVADLLTLARNSLEVSLLDPAAKARHLTALAAYAGAAALVEGADT
ncbi:MAG: adenosine deaminase [Pseudomonadota bacterium]|nr:adenosine deaminase [Pseudomonadota bacterium]